MNIFFALLFLLILVPFALAGASMAPWVPTRSRDVSRVLDILDLQKGQRFLEIGVGDGRVSFAAAKKFPKAHITGIELAIPLYLVAKYRAWRRKEKNVTLIFWDAFKKDFWDYDVIYVYGMPEKMQSKIVPKFLREAKSGAKLLSYVFSVPDFSTPSALRGAPPHLGGAKYEVISHGKEGEAKIHILEKK